MKNYIPAPAADLSSTKLKKRKGREKIEDMSYEVRYRERTIEYRRERHTLEETSQILKVSTSTIRKWEKQLRETGSLKKRPSVRGFWKLDPEKLKA